LVTDLVEGFGGAVFAATIPNGKIVRLDGTGKVSDFATPEGAEQIWALAYDQKKKVLYAATGPDGKIFAIDSKGRAEVYLDTRAAHVMTLALDEDGTLYAGTDGEALLYAVRGAGRGEVLHDFEGNEVTTIALGDGVLAVGANQFPKPKTVKKPATKKDDKDSKDKTSKDAATELPKPGKGQLWRIEPGGQSRMLFAPESGHITAVQWSADGDIFAATGKDGHIHRVHSDGSHALWIDVDERQVLALAMQGKRPLFVTGDGAAVHEVLARAARAAVWESKVLDAKFASRWGQLTWRGDGKLGFQTRSGNTSKPDDSWSEWSSVLEKAGPIRSPRGRFLQIKATLGTQQPSMIYAVTAYYLPDNQAMTLKEISVAPKLGAKSSSSSSTKREPPTPTTSYSAKWKVDNPDKDDLRYRLFYRRDGRKQWLPILEPHEILTSTAYTWDTRGIPDGFYRLRVDVTDELSNPEHAVVKSSLASEPFRVDNHPPHLAKLRYANGVLRGEASDSLGPIASIEVAIDSGDFKPVYPVDDLLDTKLERFEVKLSLTAGAHVIAIRATDARNNSTIAQVEVP
jgi:hypothetical protein